MLRRFHVKSSIFAGIIATIAVTAITGLFGIDSVKMLGHMIGQKGLEGYVLGGGLQLLLGILYALLYGVLFEPLFRALPKFLSGAIYSLLPFTISTTMAHYVLKEFENQSPMAIYKKTAFFKEMDTAPTTDPTPIYPPPPSQPRTPTANNTASTSPTCVPCGCSSREKRPPPASGTKPPGTTDMSTPKYEEETSSPMDPFRIGSIVIPGWIISFINNLIYGVVLGVTYRPHKKKTRK